MERLSFLRTLHKLTISSWRTSCKIGVFPWLKWHRWYQGQGPGPGALNVGIFSGSSFTSCFLSDVLRTWFFALVRSGGSQVFWKVPINTCQFILKPKTLKLELQFLSVICFGEEAIVKKKLHLPSTAEYHPSAPLGESRVTRI